MSPRQLGTVLFSVMGVGLIAAAATSAAVLIFVALLSGPDLPRNSLLGPLALLVILSLSGFVLLGMRKPLAARLLDDA